MIVAVWRKWVERGQWWWLAVLVAVMLADVLIGGWLITQELRLLREAW